MATVLRFHDLANQGVFQYDEACHLIDAAKLRADVVWIAAACWSKVGGGTLPPLYDGMYFGNLARPAHFAMMAILGSDKFSLLAMATFGVASVFLVFKLGENMQATFSRRACSYLPEFAALLVALSPVHAFHSRTVLAETNALFFLLAAIFYYPKAQNRRQLYFLGAILGTAFAVQSRLTLIIPYLLVAEIIARRSLGRVVSIAGGFLIPVVFFESFYNAINFSYWMAGTAVHVATYTDLYVTTMVDAGGILRFNKPWFGLRYVAFAESFLMLVLFIGSAIFWVRHRKNNMTLIFWIGFGIWITAVASLLDQNKMPGYRYGRMVAPAIPAIAMGAAFALDALWRHSNRGRLLSAACLFVILFSRIELLEGIFLMKADHNRIFHEVAARTQTAKIFSEEPYHVIHYMGKDSYPAMFSPRTDSITVIIFNEGYARNFPFFYILPDTPTFRLDGVYRTSRMGEFEEGHNGLDRFPDPAKPSLPVKVWVLGPESKPKIPRLF